MLQRQIVIVAKLGDKVKRLTNKNLDRKLLQIHIREKTNFENRTFALFS